MNSISNRYENVLLFTLPVRKADVQIPYGPYCGVGYIAEALKKNKIACKVVDLRFKKNRENLLNIIAGVKPDLIGTTMFSQGYKYSYNYLEKIKLSFPDIKIVVGGPHASTFREKMLNDCPAIDYGVTFDGDDTMVNLCQGSSFDTVKGILYRDNGGIKYNGDSPFIYDLDRLDFPRYQEFGNFEDYAVKSIAISTSRGCYAKCTFCSVVCTHGRKIRLRSAESVAEEISYWYQKGYYIISITDDNFVVNKTRVLTICDILRSKGFNKLQIKLDNGIRADCVDEELLKAMFEAGVNKVSFGVESANDNILANIKKDEPLAAIENAIRIALKVGMQVHLTFIIGLPGETEKEVRNSFEFARRMGVNNAQFYSLVPYPGSELFDWAKEKGYLLYEPDEYLNLIVEPGKEETSLLDTPELPKELRKSLYKEGQKVRRSIERKKQVDLLKPKFGRILTVILILIYTNKIFEKFYERSYLLKRYIFKLRAFLKV